MAQGRLRVQPRLLLRCITTITTGQAFFEKLADIDTAAFRDGLLRAEKAMDRLLDMIGSRLGLDYDRVLGSRYSFPLMARYLSDRNLKLEPVREADRLLFWYVHSFLWGRRAGSGNLDRRAEWSFCLTAARMAAGRERR